MKLIDTAEATAVIADYFDEICDTEITFNESEILRRLNKKASEQPVTITYTFDETRPTNKDYLIAVLTDNIDDGGAEYESMVEHDLACPYCRDSDCLNEHEKNEYRTVEYRNGCIRCKETWLERFFDTYPSKDGIWEIQDE